ncbi:hypothetical protein E2C01_058589 [Portunus trituberculatus]|uniref:Uncharacterized protein n=1 Tax=Portunus trituberculatus TaxID=210409 RepID=A0A5B7H082_PORTR|nr:hypothetical protein [Portunus trituberculatus]
MKSNGRGENGMGGGRVDDTRLQVLFGPLQPPSVPPRHLICYTPGTASPAHDHYLHFLQLREVNGSLDHNGEDSDILKASITSPGNHTDPPPPPAHPYINNRIALYGQAIIEGSNTTHPRLSGFLPTNQPTPPPFLLCTSPSLPLPLSFFSLVDFHGNTSTSSS